MIVQVRRSGMAAISTAHMSTSQYYQNFKSGIVDIFAKIVNIFVNVVDLCDY